MFLIFVVFFFLSIDTANLKPQSSVQDLTDYVEPEINGTFLETIGYRIYPSHPFVGWIIAISIPIILFCFVDNYFKNKFKR